MHLHHRSSPEPPQLTYTEVPRNACPFQYPEVHSLLLKIQEAGQSSPGRQCNVGYGCLARPILNCTMMDFSQFLTPSLRSLRSSPLLNLLEVKCAVERIWAGVPNQEYTFPGPQESLGQDWSAGREVLAEPVSERFPKTREICQDLLRLDI